VRKVGEIGVDEGAISETRADFVIICTGKMDYPSQCYLPQCLDGNIQAGSLQLDGVWKAREIGVGDQGVVIICTKR
jgi:hypothetical protein